MAGKDELQRIPVSGRAIAGAIVQTVNARELHTFLGSKQEFANWIKNRVEQYGFAREQDFTVDKFINGRATVIDYHISIDMAKELSMVERTAKGKEARQYFIDCERRAIKVTHGNTYAIDRYALGQIICPKSRHGPQWAKVAFMQEVGVRSNCKAGSLSYPSTAIAVR